MTTWRVRSTISFPAVFHRAIERGALECRLKGKGTADVMILAVEDKEEGRKVLEKFRYLRFCLRKHTADPLHPIETGYYLRTRMETVHGRIELWLTVRKKPDMALLSEIVVR